MKKLIAFSLLVLFVCLIAGTAPLRYGLKQRARAEMRQRLKRDVPATALTYFADTALKAAVWEKEDEFRLNGRLYDVARLVWRGGILYYGCIDDVLERRMEHQADAVANALLDRPSTPRGRLAKALLDWLQGLYFPPGAAPATVYAAIAFKQVGTELSAPVLHPYLDNVSPPPRSV